MAGSVVNAASVASATTALSCAMPTGTIQNDVMLGAVTADWGTYANIAAPAGWTLLTGQNNGTNTINTKLFTKTAGASEAGPYAFVQGASSDGVVAIVSLRGVDEAGAIASIVHVATTSTTRTAPSVAGATSGSVLVCGANCDGITGGTVTWTPPSGMTEQFEVESGQFTAMSMATLLNPSDPSGTKDFTTSAAITTAGGDQWSVVFLASGPGYNPPTGMPPNVAVDPSSDSHLIAIKTPPATTGLGG